MTEIPVIETDRMILRGPQASDWEDYAAFRASPRMSTVGGPFNRREAFQQFCALIGHWQVRGYGRWVMTDKETGEFLGVVGIYFPEGWPEPEIAWSVADAGEGRGLAQEAALAARAWAYQSLGWTRLMSLVDPSNERSVALAKRMGCEIGGTFEHPDFGTLTYWYHPGPEAQT